MRQDVAAICKAMVEHNLSFALGNSRSDSLADSNREG